KEPDARYQTAEGLAHDLALVRDELQAGRTAPVNLGTRDFPRRLRAPDDLIGRGAELSVLTAQYAEARRGRARAVFISGPTGVGKGKLAEELRPSVLDSDGWMVAGRYDQYRQDSRSDAIWQSMRDLGRQVLTAPDERLAECRRNMKQALGSNAGLLATLAP